MSAVVSYQPGQLVSGETLLEILFPPDERPTLRWLRDQTKLRNIPYRKIGGMVRFDVDEVRNATFRPPHGNSKLNGKRVSKRR